MHKFRARMIIILVLYNQVEIIRGNRICNENNALAGYFLLLNIYFNNKIIHADFNGTNIKKENGTFKS